MSYEKMTPDKWIANLLSGKFQNGASAKKSIAKTGWSERTKTRARALAEQHFERPGSVKAADLVKRNGKLDDDPVGALGAAAPVPIPIKATVDMTTARLMGVQHVVRGCREVLETLKVAAELYPTADVSNGMIVVDNLLPQAIAELVRETKTALAPKPNGAKPIEATAPPIVPNITKEQKELFDKTKPKIPFVPIS